MEAKAQIAILFHIKYGINNDFVRLFILSTYTVPVSSLIFEKKRNPDIKKNMGTQGEGIRFDNTSCVFSKEVQLPVGIFACIITTPNIIGKRMLLMVFDITNLFIS